MPTPGITNARDAQCVYCTNEAITFLGSAGPQLPFGMNIGLVQIQNRFDRQPRSFPIFPLSALYGDAYTWYYKRP